MEMELAVADRSTDQSVTVLDSPTADSRRPCREIVPATERRSTNALRMRYRPSSSRRELKNISRGREGRIGGFPGGRASADFGVVRVPRMTRFYSPEQGPVFRRKRVGRMGSAKTAVECRKHLFCFI
jgi:hypothetical protein